MKTKYLVLAFLGSSVLFLTWLALPLPPEKQDHSQTFYDRNGDILFTENLVKTEKTSIPETLIKALIASEDQHFYRHFGLDGGAVFRAAYQNLSQGEIISGASTLTMQLARLKYLKNEPRNLWYKIRQILQAFKLEWHLSKREILDQYLDKAVFGNGTTGIYQASERYFSKAPNQLNLAEQAMLIGILPNPSRFNPLHDPQAAEKRKRLTLERMQKQNFIDEETFEYWKLQSPEPKPQVNREITAPHFVFWVQNQLQYSKEKNNEIHTTLDKTLYQDLLRIVQEELRSREPSKNLQSASVVVLDNASGEIRAMIGSINFFDQEVDGAVNMATSPRATGSILKPFLYALALERGWSPLDEIVDEPQGYPTPEGQYNPRNFYFHQFYGRVRMREALVNSYNLSAVYLLHQLGLRSFDTLLKSLEVDLNLNKQDLGLSVILGSGEADLLTLTNAYRTFANHGVWRSVAFIKEKDPRTSEMTDYCSLVTGNCSLRQIFSPQTTDWITHALSDNIARYKLFGENNILEIDRPAAAKTGTSQEFKDNWVIGYSPRYTVGVWVGNPDGSPLHTSSGIEGAGPIWNRIMRRLHHGTPKKAFSYVSDRQEATVCRRPYEVLPECGETYFEFLTPQEWERFRPSQKPPLRISFPSDGDRFHRDTKLLLQAINQGSSETQFYLNGQKTAPLIPHLAPGRHTIWVTSGEEVSQKIEIIVE